MHPVRRNDADEWRLTWRSVRSRAGRLLAVCTAATLVASAGCGTDFEDVAAASGSSAAFTILDIVLTDAANAMLDQRQPAPGRAGDGAEDEDEDGAVDEDGADEGDGGAGAASPGEQAFADAGCGACHGQDAVGGSGPALFGTDQLAGLEERFGGGAAHYGTTLTDQEIQDVADWLLGDQTADGGDGGDAGNGGDEDAGGSAAAGEQAFAGAGCSACHGNAAEGASGPALAGMDELAALEERFGGGASHLGTTLTDAEITDVAAWLASL